MGKLRPVTTGPDAVSLAKREIRLSGESVRIKDSRELAARRVNSRIKESAVSP
jgi:hypothetical protein